MTGSKETLISEQEAKDGLREAFECRTALLVVDDVWTIDHADTFSVTASPTRLFITMFVFGPDDLCSRVATLYTLAFASVSSSFFVCADSAGILARRASSESRKREYFGAAFPRKTPSISTSRRTTTTVPPFTSSTFRTYPSTASGQSPSTTLRAGANDAPPEKSVPERGGITSNKVAAIQWAQRVIFRASR